MKRIQRERHRTTLYHRMIRRVARNQAKRSEFRLTESHSKRERERERERERLATVSSIDSGRLYDAVDSWPEVGPASPQVSTVPYNRFSIHLSDARAVATRAKSCCKSMSLRLLVRRCETEKETTRPRRLKPSVRRDEQEEQ